MKKPNKKIKSKSKSQPKYKLPIPNYINIPNNENNKINSIKKYDKHKLNSLLDDLAKKDSEYDLIIQGLKEKINAKKRENNFLLKEIETISKNNNDITKQNKKIKIEQDIKIKEKNIEFKYKNNMNNLNMINIKDKYNQEISKNKEIKDNTNNDINTEEKDLKENEDDNINIKINNNIQNNISYENFEKYIFDNSKNDNKELKYDLENYNNPINYDLYYQSMYQMYPQMNDYYKKAKTQDEVLGGESQPLVLLNSSLLDPTQLNMMIESKIYSSLQQKDDDRNNNIMIRNNKINKNK